MDNSLELLPRAGHLCSLYQAGVTFQSVTNASSGGRLRTSIDRRPNSVPGPMYGAAFYRSGA